MKSFVLGAVNMNGLKAAKSLSLRVFVSVKSSRLSLGFIEFTFNYLKYVRRVRLNDPRYNRGGI